MKRKTKVLLFISFFIIVAIGGLVYSQGFGRKDIRKELSDRAKEYLKDQDKTQSLREADLGDKPRPASTVYGKKEKMNDCFNFSIPFTIDNHHQEGTCNEYFSLTNPRGTIYANEVSTSIVSINDLSDVTMRRAMPDNYEESHLQAGQRDFLVFRNKQEGFQKTAFYFTGDKIFTLTFSSDNVPASEQKFKAILASLELL
jgi:hypothetical protein